MGLRKSLKKLKRVKVFNFNIFSTKKSGCFVQTFLFQILHSIYSYELRNLLLNLILWIDVILQTCINERCKYVPFTIRAISIMRRSGRDNQYFLSINHNLTWSASFWFTYIFPRSINNRT
jgi:hypothetical protein